MPGAAAYAGEPLRLALAAPVFAAPGYPTLRTPSLEAASWAAVRGLVLRAEELGFDSAWFSDHLFHGRDGAFFESWTALCVAAGETSGIRLVNNHLGNGLRDARMLAKMATTLAAITDGRFDLFLATGYREREYRAYGLPWEPLAVRTRRLAEALKAVRLLWPGRPVDAGGEFYPLRDAVAAPSYGQRPFIWLGGPLDGATCELVAAEADGWNSFPLTLDEYREQAARVDAACVAIGRDPRSLRRSLETQVLVLDDASDWDRWLDRWRSLRAALPLGSAVDDLVPAPEELDDEFVTATCRSRFIVGTRAEVARRVAAYRAAGVTDLVCWLMDAPSDASMTALAGIVESIG